MLVEEGDPAEVIGRIADEQHCDLILTGTARNERLGRRFVGSSVNGLLQTTKTPVLIVKNRPVAPYSKVAVATDFSKTSREALLAALSWFGDRPLTLFNAYDVPLPGFVPNRVHEDYRKAVVDDCETFLDTSSISALARKRLHIVLKPGLPRQLLRDHVAVSGTDLVVIGTRGCNASFDLSIGSTAKEIVGLMPCDVLVVPETQIRRT